MHGFTAELGASGAFCPPHKRLPVTVFFYAPGGTNAPYMVSVINYLLLVAVEFVVKEYVQGSSATMPISAVKL